MRRKPKAARRELVTIGDAASLARIELGDAASDAGVPWWQAWAYDQGAALKQWWAEKAPEVLGGNPTEPDVPRVGGFTIILAGAGMVWLALWWVNRPKKNPRPRRRKRR